MERRNVFLKVPGREKSKTLSVFFHNNENHTPLLRLLGEAAQYNGRFVGFGVRRAWVVVASQSEKYTSPLKFSTRGIWIFNIHFE